MFQSATDFFAAASDRDTVIPFDAARVATVDDTVCHEVSASDGNDIISHDNDDLLDCVMDIDSFDLCLAA